jgi:CBS domain containing-hemolysin-like protein
MEYLFFAILFLIIGGFLSFFSNIFDSISREDIDKVTDTYDGIIEKLHQLNNKYEHAYIGLLLLEIFLYVVSSALLGIFYAVANDGVAYFVLYLILFLLVTLGLRTVMTSLAYRFGIKATIKYNAFLNLLFSMVIPLTNVYIKAVHLLSGQGEDEAARDEITALVENAMEDGYIDEDEYRIMKNIMHYGDVLVSDVMTPRTVIFSYEADKKISEVINVPELLTFSRFPIWEGKSIDEHVVGYIVTKEILNAALKNKTEEELRSFARKIHYIPENAMLDDAMKQFIKLRQHIFLVVDEYGGIEGLLSMEDVIENLLGVEIVDEADRVVDMRELAKQRRDKRIKEMYSQLLADDNKEAENGNK